MHISVIIPTYKPGEYIWECLDSIINQTFPKKEFEVIIVLNGCSDPWKGSIEHYISTKMSDMNVKFICTEHAGVSMARNIALDNSLGKYVAFIDDDDYVSPRFLEGLYARAACDTVVLCYPYAYNDGEQEKQVRYELTNVYEKCHAKQSVKLTSIARKYFSGPCMKLIPMSIIHTRRFDTRFKNGEDSLYMFLISDRIKFLRFTYQSAVYYRRFRVNSAALTPRSSMDVISNSIKMTKVYFSIYFRNPFNYSFIFFLSRLLGIVRVTIKNFLR